MKDKDNKVTKQELGNVMRSLGQNPSEDEVTDMIKKVDPDNNGEITLEKFLDIVKFKMENISEDEEIEQTFKVFDKSESGYISAEDLAEVMKSLGTVPLSHSLSETRQVSSCRL
jgi:Ca2+-binding EF-hand superfamily protein